MLAIKIRQPISEPKYVWVGGGQQSGLFLAQAIRPGFSSLVVEGEFDALLGWQEIRDLVNVVTLGSADVPPDQVCLQQLLASPLLFLCYDNDQAGKDGAARWFAHSNRLRSTKLPSEKDLTDFHLGGGDLHNWIAHLLQGNLTDATRHPTLGVSTRNGKNVGVGSPTRRLPDTSDSSLPVFASPESKEAVACCG